MGLTLARYAEFVMNILKKDKSELMLHEKNIYKALFVTALPLMLSNFIIALLDIADTFFVGHMKDSAAAQAGMGIAWPVINIMLALGTGLSAAGLALISRFLGAEDYERAGRYGGLLLGTSFVAGVLVNVVLFAAASALMRFMGAEGAVLNEATVYLRISSFEMAPLFVFSAFCSIRQSMGDMVTPVVLSIFGAVVNIGLAVALVMGFEKGVYGAAVSSVAGQFGIVPFYVRALFKDDGKMKLKREYFRFDGKGIKKLAALAAPAVGGQILASFGFVILQAVILKLGSEVSAAFSIGNKISNIILAVVMGMGTAMSAFVGQNIGAKNKERAKNAYRASRNASVVLMFCGIVVLFPLRRWMAGFMSNDVATAQEAMGYIGFVLLTLPGLALYQNYISVFNGSGKTGLSLCISFIWVWLLRIPMVLVFTRWIAPTGMSVWYAMGISNLAVALAGHILLRRVSYE